jgi:putative membrane protein insertion efficiency factor
MTMRTLLSELLILLLQIYRVSLGALLGPACRFEPTCSRYAQDAIEQHGVLRGIKLTAARIARCHPLGGSGYDPVP